MADYVVTVRGYLPVVNAIQVFDVPDAEAAKVDALRALESSGLMWSQAKWDGRGEPKEVRVTEVEKGLVPGARRPHR